MKGSGLEEVITGYKVVTADLRSLGLRQNPNILTYPVGHWYFLPPQRVVSGKGDYGGIWVVRTLSAARRLKNYMRDHHGVETRIFEAHIARILYLNSYRIKTDGVFLTEEIN
jgi:hypothetical protein